MLTFNTPAYLFTSQEACYRCGEKHKVISLVAERYEPGFEECGDDLVSLIHIRALPSDILEFMQLKNANYIKNRGGEYYTNSCSCGAYSGDFYLHKLGGAFYPENEEEAKKITIEAIAVTGRFVASCSTSQTLESVIFEHGQFISSKN